MENPLLRMRGLPDSSVEKTKTIEAPIAKSGVDHDFVYAGIFAILGVAAALWFSISAQGFLDAPQVHAVGLVAAAGVTIALVMIMQSLLIVSRFWNVVLISVQSLSMLYSFYADINPWFIVAILCFIVSVVHGYFSARNWIDQSLKFSFLHYAYKFDSSFFTGITLFITIFVIALYQSVGGISQPTYELFFRGVETPLSYGFGVPVTAETPMYDAVSQYVRKQLSTQPEFAMLTQAQQGAASQFTTQNIIAQIGDKFGVPVSDHESVGAYTYGVLQAGIAKINSIGLGWPVALALLLIGAFSLRSALFLLKIPLLIIAYIVYILLLSTSVITIASESRPKEVLVIK